MFDFELFVKTSTRTVAAPGVTLQRGGAFALNRAACELLGMPAAVELMFDSVARVIGLRAASADLPHVYAVRSQKGSTTRLVTGRAFTRHFAIPTDTARRYPATMLGDVLAVALQDDGRIPGAGGEDLGTR